MGEPEKNSRLFILYDYVVVIQLVRMPACQVGCRGFKSHLLLIYRGLSPHSDKVLKE